MRRKLVAALLLVVTSMAACSTERNAVIPGDGVALQKQQRQVLLQKKVADLLDKGSYRRAIEVMGGRKGAGSPAAGMEREYLTAVNGLLTEGEDAFSRGEYATAGKAFKWALDFTPADQAFRNRVRLEPRQIKTRLESCSDRLMEQGLQEYRRGKLESAIRKWKGILAFQAGHTEARKALETASVQLRALQSMENR